MKTEINSISFNKIFKAINIKLQKKISKFISDYLSIKINVLIKECGIDNLINITDKICIKYYDGERYFMFLCDKLFARAIADQFVEGEIILSNQKISITESKIFAYGLAFDLFAYYFKCILGEEIEKDNFVINISENPLEDFFEGESVSVIYAEFEAIIKENKLSFSFVFPSKFFKERFESLDIKKIMEEKKESSKIDKNFIPINLKIVFGKTFLTAKEFSNLKVGDIIKLDKNSPSDIFIIFDNDFKIKGSLGKIKNKLAIKLNI